MKNASQVHEAKARFSKFLEASCRDGPQFVTRRGVEAAALLPIEQWRSLRKAGQPDLKVLLLAPEARTDDVPLTRSRYGHRPALALE